MWAHEMRFWVKNLKCCKGELAEQGKGVLSVCNYVFDGFWKNERSNTRLMSSLKIASGLEILKSSIIYESLRDLHKKRMINL